MLSPDNIADVLSILRLDNKKITDGNDFVSVITTHVQAEPKILSRIFPKLCEQVSSYTFMK